jgi:predicted NUDIX family NTP pyrophosphohydrolase
MPVRSAGILLYRLTGREPEVLLIHPGGPFWTKKDEGAWSIPKGQIAPDEEPLAAARREFAEETGTAPDGDAFPLGEYRQGSGKIVTVFAMHGDFDLAAFRSNLFSMEWPPRSGKMAEFPEADRAGWFSLAEASRRLIKGQVPILGALARSLASTSGR